MHHSRKGPSDPYGPKADRVPPDEFPETEAGIEDFRYAIYMETNEAAGIDLWKIGLLNRIRKNGSIRQVASPSSSEQLPASSQWTTTTSVR